MSAPNTYRAGADERGLFGMFGGRFVAETLMPLILELETAYNAARQDEIIVTDSDRSRGLYHGFEP